MSERPRRTFPLLPGLRWSGKLRVLDVSAVGVAVEFDATDTTSTVERWVFDRATLTPKQFRDWTGQEPER